VAKESLGSFGSAGGHKTMARAEINLAEIKEPPIDFKDDHKVAAWIVIRTEKRAGHKAPIAKPNSGSAPNG
jgi:hypothetical protein